MEASIKKYRVWDKADKKMIYPEDVDETSQQSSFPTLLAIGLHGLPIVIDTYSFKKNSITAWNVDHNRIVLEFTGFTDWEKKDVYEWDIFELIFCKVGEDDYLVGNAIVIKKFGSWWLEYFDPYRNETCYSELYKTLMKNKEKVVIGNRCEHPNLYKGVGI